MKRGQRVRQLRAELAVERARNRMARAKIREMMLRVVRSIEDTIALELERTAWRDDDDDATRPG